MTPKPRTLNYASPPSLKRRAIIHPGWVCFVISGIISIIGCCILIDRAERQKPHYTHMQEPSPVFPLLMVLLILGSILHVASSIVGKPPAPAIAITMGLASLLFAIGIVVLV